MNVLVICVYDYLVQKLKMYFSLPPKVWNLKVFVIMETKKLIGKPLQPARPVRHLTSPPGE